MGVAAVISSPASIHLAPLTVEPLVVTAGVVSESVPPAQIASGTLMLPTWALSFTVMVTVLDHTVVWLGQDETIS